MLGALLAMALVMPAAAAPPKPKDAKVFYNDAGAAEIYTEQDYDGSVAEAEAGYKIEEHESLLFIWAQAERQRHNCIEAVELFNAFIATTKDEDMKQNALTAKAKCAEELAEIARKAEEDAAAAAEAAAEEEAAEEADVPPPPPPRPWYRDPVGDVLVGVGGAGILAGGSLLIAAAILDPAKAPIYEDFAARQVLQPKLLLAGGITAGVGVVIAAAGGVRWGLVARKNKRDAAATQARMRVGPWVDGRRAGVVLSGRF